MPNKLVKPKPKGQPTQDVATSPPKASPMKNMAKKMKRQLGRLDDMLHHVTHPKHEPKEVVKPKQRSRTISSSSTSSNLSAKSAIKVVRAFFPSPSSSRRSSTRIWHSKYNEDPESSSSSEHLPHLSYTPPPVEPPSTTEITMTTPKEEPVNSEPMFTSPPTVYVEPETPDPFLVDDESDDEDTGKPESSGTTTPTAADIPLSPTPSRPPMSPLPNVNKDMPPPPPSDSDSEEAEEIPDIYVPALIAPTMFLPIPNTDPLTTLLNKYIYPPEMRPPRDLTGDWQRADFHTLVMTNSWRALARLARDRLVTSDPSDLTLVLGLWHLRLSCLARLRLFNQTAAECTNLFSVLNAIQPPEARTYVFERILPFELEVMQTRLKYWAGDHMGYLDALHALLKKCRTKCRQSGDDATLVPMWKERGARVCLIIASQMVEMKEITAAGRLLQPLCKQKDVSNPALRSAVARIYLQGGDVQEARKQFALVEADPEADDNMKKTNAAFLACAQGEWESASAKLQELLAEDANNFAAVNNLSVALLSQGKLKEGIDVLEKALRASPSSVVVAEPFLFNLSTLYELRSTVGLEKKKELLVEVAKWSGDGLRTNCLKLPAN